MKYLIEIEKAAVSVIELIDCHNSLYRFSYEPEQTPEFKDLLWDLSQVALKNRNHKDMCACLRTLMYSMQELDDTNLEDRLFMLQLSVALMTLELALHEYEKASKTQN